MKKRVLLVILISFMAHPYPLLSVETAQAETLSTEQLAETAGTEVSSENHASITESSEKKQNEQESTVSSTVSSSEQSDEQATTAPLEKTMLQEQAAADEWKTVSTLAELKAALNAKEPLIKLAASSDVFDLGTSSVSISADVTIDGNGRQLSYYGNSGFISSTNGLTITLQNMTFGSPDYTVNAVGLYGIMQTSYLTDLYVNNVNYYSNRTAQPFYVRGAASKIHFQGTNQFMQQNPDGSVASGEEFAECNNLIFEAGTKTTIVQNTNGALGFMWMFSNPGNITVNDGADVSITTNHNLIYSDGSNNGTITLGKQAKLSIKGTNTSKGNFYYATRPAYWSVGEGAELSIDYPNSVKLGNNSTIAFSPDSVGKLSVSANESFFSPGVGAGSSFTIDNAKSIYFQGKPGTANNPIGFSGGTNQFTFSPFQGNTPGYEVIADQTSLTSQLDPGSWTIAAGPISRQALSKTPDFTADEKTAIQRSNRLTLQRLNPPVQLLDVGKNIQVNDAAFHLSDYQLNGNESRVQKVSYKLYSKQVSDPNTATAGLIEEQSKDTLTDTADFSNLKEKTDYWLYVRIICDLDSQSSEWLEVPFTTQQEMINVDFPIEVAFYSKKEGTEQKILPADSYTIDNHSSFPVTVQATDLTELSNPGGIQLLSQPDAENPKGMLLRLTQDANPLGVLTKELSESPLTFKELGGKSSTTLGFSGNYYGERKQSQQVQYRLTLVAERKE